MSETIESDEPISRRESRRRRPANRALRVELWAEQKGKCCYCECVTRLPENKEPSALRVATVEHRISVANGGTDDRENLAMSCSACNNAKGDLNEDEFIRNGLRGRPPGVTREMVHLAKKERRQGKRPSPDRLRAILVGNVKVAMELAIRERVQEIAAERFRPGGELHGRRGMRRKVLKMSEFEGVMRVMERRLEREVEKVSDARFPQRWGRERLPKTAFDKRMAFTGSLADRWPTTLAATGSV